MLVIEIVGARKGRNTFSKLSILYSDYTISISIDFLIRLFFHGYVIIIFIYKFLFEIVII